MAIVARALTPRPLLGRLAARYRLTRSKRLPRRRVEAETLAVAVAVRNRSGPRVDNFLATLRAQTVPARCVDITVCDFGSDAESLEDLRASCARFGARLVITGDTSAEWNKPWGLNLALRHGDPAARFVLPTDIDMLFAPDFVETLLRVHLVYGPALVMCRFKDLPATALDGEIDVVGDFERLAGLGEWVGEHACGPCLSTARAWCEKVRGFDERFKLWGFMDSDYQARAERDGLRPVWVDERTTLLHQWHPRKFDVHRDDPEQQQKMRLTYEANRKLMEGDTSIVRNASGWGELPPGGEVIEPGSSRTS
jgi:hypothetical protein